MVVAPRSSGGRKITTFSLRQYAHHIKGREPKTTALWRWRTNPFLFPLPSSPVVPVTCSPAQPFPRRLAFLFFPLSLSLFLSLFSPHVPLVCFTLIPFPSSSPFLLPSSPHSSTLHSPYSITHTLTFTILHLQHLSTLPYLSTFSNQLIFPFSYLSSIHIISFLLPFLSPRIGITSHHTSQTHTFRSLPSRSMPLLPSLVQVVMVVVGHGAKC